MKAFIDEFKSFAMKGNVVDLAVAVVLGVAFGKVVSSLVADIIMPVVGILLGGISFSGLQYQLGDAMITYGTFIQAVVDFAIVALALFVVVKAINKAQEVSKDTSSEEEEKPEEPSEEVKLLREIRDGLVRRY